MEVRAFVADNEIAVTLLLVCSGARALRVVLRVLLCVDPPLCVGVPSCLAQLGGWMLFLVGYVDIAETASRARSGHTRRHQAAVQASVERKHAHYLSVGVFYFLTVVAVLSIGVCVCVCVCVCVRSCASVCAPAVNSTERTDETRAEAGRST